MSGRGVRQEQVLAALAAYWAKEGVSPSLRDLAKAVGLVSPSTIAWHLQRLRAAQPPLVAFKEQDGRMLPRTLRLVEQTKEKV